MPVLERSATSYLEFYSIASLPQIQPNALAESDDPIEVVSFTVELPSGSWSVVAERFDDNTWAAYFADNEGVVAAGDTRVEAINGLFEEVVDAEEDLSEYEGNLSDELTARLLFLRKVLGV